MLRPTSANSPPKRPLVPVEDAELPPQLDRVGPDSEEPVREALDSLSPARREVLRLVHKEGLTQSPIADRLELPLATVNMRMFHRLRAPRAELIERGFRAGS